MNRLLSVCSTQKYWLCHKTRRLCAPRETNEACDILQASDVSPNEKALFWTMASECCGVKRTKHDVFLLSLSFDVRKSLLFLNATRRKIDGGCSRSFLLAQNNWLCQSHLRRIHSLTHGGGDKSLRFRHRVKLALWEYFRMRGRPSHFYDCIKKKEPPHMIFLFKYARWEHFHLFFPSTLFALAFFACSL